MTLQVVAMLSGGSLELGFQGIYDLHVLTDAGNGIHILLGDGGAVVEQHVLPRGETLTCPVAIDALICGDARIRHLVEDDLDVLRCDVVRVDENREPQVV